MPVTTGQQGSSVSLTCACHAKETIKVPEKKEPIGGNFSTTGRMISPYKYLAFRLHRLNFAGVLDACRSKLHTLIQHHRQHVADAKGGKCHSRAIQRLQNTMSGAAMSYEDCFRRRAQA